LVSVNCDNSFLQYCLDDTAYITMTMIFTQCHCTARSSSYSRAGFKVSHTPTPSSIPVQHKETNVLDSLGFEVLNLLVCFFWVGYQIDLCEVWCISLLEISMYTLISI
jgi:hypothetical protein